MNWSITNAPNASPAARQIIRAAAVLDTAIAADHDMFVPLTAIADMLDLRLSEWALGLSEILTTGLGITIDDDHGRECLFLTITPHYTAS